MTSVREALHGRRSVRAFLDRPVERTLIEDLLTLAGRAPSGGNLQPWQVNVVAGDARQRVIDTVREVQATHPFGEPEPEYSVYPKPLGEPWRSRRFACGETMYASVGLPREDKMGRLVQVAKNFEFFGAPVGLFLSTHKNMQPGQWSDLGMFLQSFMLSAHEAGLGSCAQESWAIYPHAVKQAVGIKADFTLFCGLALGYADPDAAINSTQTSRAPLDEIVSFDGFDANGSGTAAILT
ncbi:MAG: nitroreductase [Maricaulis sp.]|jgi:nitroreductase|nr:nitroreductase [Maricaulis sp.]